MVSSSLAPVRVCRSLAPILKTIRRQLGKRGGRLRNGAILWGGWQKAVPECAWQHVAWQALPASKTSTRRCQQRLGIVVEYVVRMCRKVTVAGEKLLQSLRVCQGLCARCEREVAAK